MIGGSGQLEDVPRARRIVGIGASTGLAVAALMVLSTCGGQEPERSPPKPRPNVVVLLTDDQTLESMRVMHNVRRLIGKRGTTFDHSFASFPLCCPSRATLFTGQYAHNHGVLHNVLPLGGYAKLDKRRWLPVWLQRAGYRTMHVGKFLNGYGRDGSKPTDVPQGFEEWHGSVDPSTYDYYRYTLNENGRLRTYGARRDSSYYQTDFYARRASDLIRRAARSRRPFFLSLGFLAPHSGGPVEPGDPPELDTPAPAPRHRNRLASEALPRNPSFNETDVSDKPRGVRGLSALGQNQTAAIRKSYQQELESLLSVDEAVASVLESLRSTGELRNTLVIYSSDNGYFHGEHRLLAGKARLYEPSIRVPLVMRGPGVPSGARRSQMVSNADLTATILDAAKVRAGRRQDGRSLFGLLRDRGREWGRDLLIEGGDGGPGAFDALRTRRYIYAEYQGGGRELYDLRRDPFQLDSRHADARYGAVRTELARRLAALRSCAGRGCRVRPRLRLRTVLRRWSCRRRGRVRVDVRGPDQRWIERIAISAYGRRLARADRPPFARELKFQARSGRRPLVRALVELADGRVVTLDRRLPPCRG